MKPTYEQLEQQLVELSVKLANVESKCAELAVENAKLADCANFYRLGFKPVKGAFGIEYRPTEQLLDDCGNTAIEAIETPATDAAIANIQARGVEMFAASERKLAAKHASTIDTSNIEYGAARADEFAAQLRQGAKS